MGERIVKSFSLEAYKAFAYFLPSDPNWTIAGDVTDNMNKGFLTSKVVCLIQLLLEYRRKETILKSCCIWGIEQGDILNLGILGG